MVWETIRRPGYAGKKRDQRHRSLDEEFGKDNWRIAWKWNGDIISRDTAVMLYEDAYYNDSFRREDIWRELVEKARDVYDIEPRDVESGLDYHIQKGKAAHLQDIAVRRVVLRRGWKFEGDELIRVRNRNDFGKYLSPGNFPFHMPQMIVKPSLDSWWKEDSVEDFYQSNKVLQALGND